MGKNNQIQHEEIVMAKAQTEAPSRGKSKKSPEPPYVGTVEELRELASQGALHGLYEVPIDVYHAGPGVSSTELKEILRSPAHYRATLEAEKDSEALRFGRLVHMAVLEPERFQEEVAIEPEVNRRTKAGKEELAQFHEDHADKMIVKRSDHELAARIAVAINSTSLAKSVLGPGQTERTAYWEDPQTGVLCKARADHIRRGYIVDFKTTQDARFRPFQRQCANFRYHLSAAYYVDGFRHVLGQEGIKGFAWVAAEKQEPHGIGFYGADPSMLESGRREYRQALQTYAECLRTDNWPAYAAEFVNLGLPPWYE